MGPRWGGWVLDFNGTGLLMGDWMEKGSSIHDGKDKSG